jgi:hypothetical protein
MLKANLIRIIIVSMILLMVGLASQPVTAENILPKVFCCHMVLQQQKPLVIWGWSDPGGTVTVELCSMREVVQANDRGEWKAVLPATNVGGPCTLAVTGSSSVEFDDVMIGEVWLRAGQSIMAFGVNRINDSKKLVAAANHPDVRLQFMDCDWPPVPQKNIRGTWMVCSPQTPAEDGWKRFSAVAYFFGLELHNTFGLVARLIESSCLGTRIDPYTSPEDFAVVPALKKDYELVEQDDPDGKLHQQRLGHHGSDINVSDASGSAFVLDMVHNNPGESLQNTSFRDPRTLSTMGYNGQVIMAEADSCETFDSIAPGILPKGSDAREWIEQHAQTLEKLAEQTHAAGIKAYAWMQFVVLPKALVIRFKDKICDEQGRIDLGRPMTQKIVRAQIKELFQRCPALDGLIVRTGEIYLFDSPYHTSSGRDNESKIQSSTAIIHGPDSHITLLKILRDEVCVKDDKMIFYRTWDFGNNFHVNPQYYLKVTDAIEPHPNLVFSIKHQAGDFLRMTPFNPTLGIGKQRQIVEVECQREVYGKGAHPFYIGDGVINGWEEYAKIMEPGRPKGLRDIVNNTNVVGVWTWSRGGGWEGPYITNELWCKLNAYVVAKFAETPNRSEQEIFDEFAHTQLRLTDEDVARFRELNLLSATAVLSGQCSIIKPVDLWWARDDFMAAPDLSMFATTSLMTGALAEKAESVKQWNKIEMLARQIHFADPATQDFVETSCTYGRIKYSIIEQAWRILLYGQRGDKLKDYDYETISAAIARYDELWKEWRELKMSHSSCATIYKDVAFQDKPGIGAAVDRYRIICDREGFEN